MCLHNGSDLTLAFRWSLYTYINGDIECTRVNSHIGEYTKCAESNCKDMYSIYKKNVSNYMYGLK